LNTPQASAQSLEVEAAKYIAAEQGVATAQEALKGASDILAEAVADTAEFRAYLRDYWLDAGELVSQIKADFPEGSTKFEMYRNYRAKVKTIPSHNLLALYRGEAEGILTLELEFSEDAVLGYLSDQVVRAKVPAVRQFYQEMLKDAFNRLMRTSLIGEVQEADEESIRTFEANLRELLLAAPAGMKPTLAIDPGFRTGCKVAVLDQTGQFLEYKTIFPHQSANQREDAARTLSQMIQKYGVELIAIGNGTAGRETDEFVDVVLATGHGE